MSGSKAKRQRHSQPPTQEEARQGAAEAYEAGLPAHLRAHWHDRIPPSHDRAEQLLLGALMANNLALRRLGPVLEVKFFADPVHGRIFQAIARRVQAGQVADVITLAAEFEHTDTLSEVGGSEYLRALVGYKGVVDVTEYARTIADAWLRRQIIDRAEQIVLAASAAIDGAFGKEPLTGCEVIHRLRKVVQEHLDGMAEESFGLEAPF